MAAEKSVLGVADPANDPVVGMGDPVLEEQAAFARDSKSAIDDIAAEFEAANRVEDTEDTEPSTSDTQPSEKPELEVEPEANPPAESKEKEDPAIARGLDRLIAREIEVKTKADDAERLMAQARAEMAKAKALEGLKSTAELKELAKHSLSKVMEALGQDPATAIRLMLAEQLGDKAPAELKQFAKEAEYNRKLYELEQRLKEKDRASEVNNYFNVISSGAREYVKSVGDSTPTVKLIAKVNPDRVHSEIMEEITKDARTKAASDPSADLITYEEATKRVEARWAEIKGAVQTNVGDSTKQVPGAKTQLPPAIKPSPKPLKPWQKPEGRDLEELGIKEAMKEFNRVEGLRARG
jgi:antitoxin component of RelBE/YafQ-DinJ toxin-antitoxin module